MQRYPRKLHNFREVNNPLSSSLKNFVWDNTGPYLQNPKMPLVSQIDVAPHMWDDIISTHFFCTLISQFPFQWRMSTWLISCSASNILINSWTTHSLCVRSGNFYSKIGSSSQMHIQGKFFFFFNLWECGGNEKSFQVAWIPDIFWGEKVRVISSVFWSQMSNFLRGPENSGGHILLELTSFRYPVFKSCRKPSSLTTGQLKWPRFFQLGLMNQTDMSWRMNLTNKNGI